MADIRESGGLRRYEGEFREDKPCGEGILTESDQRYVVSYDGSKTFAEGAEPASKVQALLSALTIKCWEELSPRGVAAAQARCAECL